MSTLPTDRNLVVAAQRAKAVLQVLCDIMDPDVDDYGYSVIRTMDRMETECAFHDLREALKPYDKPFSG